tara:strand:- start:12 stop:269 length:258 start_codon:yes stop_codon:yes gene_type:complete
MITEIIKEEDSTQLCFNLDGFFEQLRENLDVLRYETGEDEKETDWYIGQVLGDYYVYIGIRHFDKIGARPYMDCPLLCEFGELKL